VALSCFVGSFTVPAATGNLPVTGVGFQPKAVLFFGNHRSSDAATQSASQDTDMPYYLGMATSSTARGVVDVQDDYSAAGTAAATSTQCIRNRNAAGTVQFAADFVSMDADGFTVNFATANATAYVVNYIALGGADLTNVAVKSFTAATATGNQASTGVGFVPDAMILVGSETTFTVGGVQIGMVTSTSARGALGNSVGSVNANYQRTALAYAQPTGTSTTVARAADLVSFDSDGFTLNWTTVQASGPTIYALCLKGGSFKAGNFTQKTSTGSQGTTGVGFQPKGLLMASSLKVASAAVTTARMAVHVGAGSSSSARGAINHLNGGTGVAELVRTQIYTARQDNATPTLNSAADLTSLDADGFTLNYGTADATAREILYLAFGNAAAAGGTFGSEAWQRVSQPTGHYAIDRVSV
jgi:hypothetical protein